MFIKFSYISDNLGEIIIFEYLTCFQGDEYVFYEDWGEQLVGKSCPVVCVLDVEAGIVSTLDNLPDNISPGQVTSVISCCHFNGVSKFF